jgi:hypothetical protein
MGGQVNIGGVWKDIASVSVNIGGAWKTASSIKCNIGGVWKDGWSVELEYGADFTEGATFTDSAHDTGYEAAKAFDNVETGENYWWKSNSTSNQWIKVDLGAIITKTARKLRIKAAYFNGAAGIKDFVFAGSNNNSDWTTIHSARQANNGNWQEYTFDNSTAYRYYRIWVTNVWVDSTGTGIFEVEMMELVS